MSTTIFYTCMQSNILLELNLSGGKKNTRYSENKDFNDKWTR